MTIVPFALIALVGLPPASADPIDVANPSFEHRESYDAFPESTDKYNQFGHETWRHWQRDFNGGPLRVWNPGDPDNPAHSTTQGAIDVGFDGSAPEGDYVILVRSRYSDAANAEGDNTFEAATQLLAETFDPSQSYTLTVQVGRPPGSVNYIPGWYGYIVQLAVGGTNVTGAQYAGRVDGGTVIAEDVNSLEVGADEFVTSTVAYSPDPAHEGLAGQALQIRLGALEDPNDLSLTSWVVYDNVTLETGFFPGAPPAPFVITDIDYVPGGESVTLTWASRSNRTYIAKFSETMAGWGDDMGDALSMENDDENPDDGDHLTKTFSLSDFGLQDKTKLFFRIEEEK